MDAYTGLMDGCGDADEQLIKIMTSNLQMVHIIAEIHIFNTAVNFRTRYIYWL